MSRKKFIKELSKIGLYCTVIDDNFYIDDLDLFTLAIVDCCYPYNVTFSNEIRRLDSKTYNDLMYLIAKYQKECLKVWCSSWKKRNIIG